MQLQCPCCGEQFPFEAGFADADGKQLAAQFANLDPKLGRAVLNYLRLFSPAKRGLRMTKAIKVVEELVHLVESGQVQRDARTAESKPAPPRLWVAGIEQMIAQRDRLSLPLTSHNYLRSVVYGIAADPAQAQAVAPAKPARKATTPQQDIQEQVGRIMSDMRLGLVSPDEGERKIKALRGE